MENATLFNDSHLKEIDADIRTRTDLYLLIFEYIQSFEYLICLLANVLTITAVVRFDYLHKKATNILILSLSIADGCLGKCIYLLFI